MSGSDHGPMIATARHLAKAIPLIASRDDPREVVFLWGLPPAARAGGRDELLPRRPGLTGDLAEGVAAALEVDERPVLVADHAADARRAAPELGRHRDARVAPAAAGEVPVGADAVDGPRERLAHRAPYRSVELAPAHAPA